MTLLMDRPFRPPSTRCPGCSNRLAPVEELADSTEWSCLWCGFRAWARGGHWLTPTTDSAGHVYRGQVRGYPR